MTFKSESSTVDTGDYKMGERRIGERAEKLPVRYYVHYLVDKFNCTPSLSTTQYTLVQQTCTCTPESKIKVEDKRERERDPMEEKEKLPVLLKFRPRTGTEPLSPPSVG